MGIVASKGSGTTFTPCPSGSHVAACCDVEDLGIIKTEFAGKPKSQHKVNLIWQVAETRDDGKPYQVRKRYTLSLHEKASLRKDLESWRGRPFTDDELEGFDLESLLGVACMLSVVHNAVAGKVYANVAAIMKLPKGIPPVDIDRSYVRVQDRVANNAGDNSIPGPMQDWGDPITDDDVPF